MAKADSLEKTLMLGKVEGKRRREQKRRRCVDGMTDSMNMSLSKQGDSGASLVAQLVKNLPAMQ